MFRGAGASLWLRELNASTVNLLSQGGERDRAEEGHGVRRGTDRQIAGRATQMRLQRSSAVMRLPSGLTSRRAGSALFLGRSPEVLTISTRTGMPIRSATAGLLRA